MPSNPRMDMTGQRFGRLVVLNYSHSKNAAFWKCQCDCGQITIVRGATLRYGTAKSCGCGSREAARRNAAMARDKRRVPHPYPRKMKDMLKNMISRCYDPSNKRWANYGGRGITVCPEWRSDIRAFYRWVVANGYKPGLTIDRIDVNGNYEPNNCRFATMIIQQNNTTRNVRLTWNNRTLTISEWARELGVRTAAIGHRHERGWTIERIFTQPFRGRR
jgi:hypothetical protein